MAKLYPISTAHNHDEVYAKLGDAGVKDHGALTGLEDNDHPQYLLTTGKAADSDKLDGIDSSGYALKYTTRKLLDDNKYANLFSIQYSQSGTYSILLNVTVQPSVTPNAYAGVSKLYYLTLRLYGEGGVAYNTYASTILGINDTGSKTPSYADIDAPLVNVVLSTVAYDYSATIQVKADALGINQQGVYADAFILPIGGRDGIVPVITWL